MAPQTERRSGKAPGGAHARPSRCGWRRIALLALAFAGACAPMVSHGPRVEPGFSGVLTFGAAYSPCDSLTCEMALLPQAALALRVGRPAGETRAGYGVGVDLSANLVSSDADFYLQAPTALVGGMDAGGGVLVSMAHTMPYVQLGRMRADGSGWYTTQGVVWMSNRPLDYALMGQEHPDEPDGLRPRYWAPSVAYRAPRGVHVYLSGAFGTADEYHWAAPDSAHLRRTGSQPVRVLMAGVIVPLRLRNLLPFIRSSP